MEEAIVISYEPHVPQKWVDEVVHELEDQEFKVRQHPREKSGAWASIEWAIPTLAIAYLLKPFFNSFLSEAGKDAYAHAKQSLKKFILKNRDTKVKWVAATQSIHKLSKTYDQSLAISVKAEIFEGFSVTVLFSEKASHEEAPLLIDGMFQILEGIYQEFQKQEKEHGETDQEKPKGRTEMYLVANFDTQQWELLDYKQITAKYRNPPVTNNKEDKKMQDIPKDEVFISYSWDSSDHERKVVNFTNHLRTEGFNAVMDKMISQEKTAVNFVRMMHEALLKYPKVIVILSEGYKEKAESFTGGVGEEYEILINDIKRNELKYILVSFEGRHDSIIPIGLRGRDIVDLSKPEEEKRLFAKLLDHKPYEFVEVGQKKPELPTIPAEPFVANVSKVPLEVLLPRVEPKSDYAYTGSQYREITLLINIELKNTTSKTVTEFSGQVKVHKTLVSDHQNYSRDGDYISLDFNAGQKAFPGQTIMVKQWQSRLTSDNIHRVIDSEIVVTVFTDEGNTEMAFNLKDVVFLKPADKRWMEAKPLSLDMFTDD